MLKQNKKSLSKRCNLNPNWKGSEVGYSKLHEWVRNRLIKPDLCPRCNKRKSIDLANKGNYNRDLTNWEWLCRRCHMESDGRLKKFLSHRKSFTNGNQLYKLRINISGENHPNSKLSNDDIISIRDKYSTGHFTQIMLAKEYGISFQNVSSIIRKLTWNKL